MAKADDKPAFRMKIEGGRLVPASSYDQERLDSYRNGTTVMVKFTEEKNRKDVRRWWAILGLVMKQCKTPWKNSTEAHEAIKLALGIVNLGKSAHGNMMQWPRSLNDLDDAELSDALEQMIALLSRITGVDVSTLKREAAAEDVEDDTPAREAVTEADGGTPATDTKETGSRDLQADVDREMMVECCRKLMAIPVYENLDAHAKRRALVAAKDGWKDTLQPELHDQLKAIFLSVDAQIKADPAVFPRLRESALAHFAEMLGCEVGDIGG